MRVGEVEFEAGTRIWGALSSAGSLRERPTPNPARFVGSGVDVYPNLSQSASLPAHTIQSLPNRVYSSQQLGGARAQSPVC